MLRIYDSQKHYVLYTWELYGVFINLQCVQNLVFLQIAEAFRAVKAIQEHADNLNFKGSGVFYTSAL